MKDNMAPEERLLRLIKGQKRQNVSQIKESAAMITEIKPNRQPPRNSLIQQYIPILNLNARKIILIVFLAACLYLVVSLVYPLVGLRKIDLPQMPAQKIIEPKIEPGQELKPYEFYLQGLKEHQIFTSTPAEVTEHPDSRADVDLVKDITLVGIISGDNPQAVIEDTKIHKTYYAAKGQFAGEFQVEDIQEGKIILNYKGKSYELYM